MDHTEKQPADAQLEEATAREEVLEIDKVQATEVITGLKTVDDASEAEASSVPEGVASKATTNIASEVFGNEDQATSDAIETDMKSNNLNFTLEDCFESSTLNHISPRPSQKSPPKPSIEHTPLHVHNRVQLSKLVMDFSNPTPIIHILENAMNLVDSEHPIGETIDDKKLLIYFYDYEQPPPLNTIFGPLMDVYSGKASSSSSSGSYSDLIVGLNLELVIPTPVFIIPIQVIPL